MEDYSKVAVVEREITQATCRKLGERSVRLVCFGVKRAAPAPRLKERNSLELLKKLLEKGATRSEVKCNYTLPLSEHSNIQ
jgi:hypothetical protein